MAGPAIRAWEFAKALCPHHSVTLAAPDLSVSTPECFELLPFVFGEKSSLRALEVYLSSKTDVLISSGHVATALPFLPDLGTPWVADVYIPTPIESLAHHASSEPDLRVRAYKAAWRNACTIAMHADFLICASERQRDFWLGVLTAFGRLHPLVYSDDPDARNLIDVVPFGCPVTPPEGRTGLRKVWPGIEPGNRIILWGGGVWDWLDPIALIRAMPGVLERHPEARLVFLGAEHPDSARVPQMRRAYEARSLSRSLGLAGKTILWGDWVPYDERGAYLVEADLGVSLHRPGLEARLAFRTRLLDAIWAGMPMVLSPGDVLAEEFARRDLAYLVECDAVDELAQAINQLLDEESPRESRREQFEELRQEFSWSRVVQPLLRFCETPRVSLVKMEAMDLRDGEAGETADEKAALKLEIARLESIIDGYRSGRLMRLLELLHRVRRRLGLA